MDERLHTPGRVRWHPETNRVLGCIQRRVGSRSRKGILPLYSPQVRPHLQCCIQLWSPQCQTDMDLLEPAQRRPPSYQRDGAPLLRGKAERIGFVQPGNEEV